MLKISQWNFYVNSIDLRVWKAKYAILNPPLPEVHLRRFKKNLKKYFIPRTKNFGKVSVNSIINLRVWTAIITTFPPLPKVYLRWFEHNTWIQSRNTSQLDEEFHKPKGKPFRLWFCISFFQFFDCSTSV